MGEGKEWLEKTLGGEWVETVMDDTKNYAGIGYTYDKEKDNFIAPQPYPSWKLNEKCRWEAPVERPKGELVNWDEKGQKWIPSQIME